MDRVFVVHAGSRGFDFHRRHMSERFSRSNRPGYHHPVCSKLENSGIRVAVGDCSVTERRRWRPFDQKKKKKKKKNNFADAHKHTTNMTPRVRGHGSVPLSH